MREYNEIAIANLRKVCKGMRATNSWDDNVVRICDRIWEDLAAREGLKAIEEVERMVAPDLIEISSTQKKRSSSRRSNSPRSSTSLQADRPKREKVVMKSIVPSSKAK